MTGNIFMTKLRAPPHFFLSIYGAILISIVLNGSYNLSLSRTFAFNMMTTHLIAAMNKALL